ncbi:MAG TPA: Ldh family oxidoreductase [Candidatus Methylomirabilis sp.]|nr:Ldh family oxidoreductase [Candidatus Methylomirabilis sp.]HSC72490.1 Ldh family oxidoreductase [Candidatus Methylomirabilis sp.]
MTSQAPACVFPASRLEAFITGVLTALGLPELDAAVCAARMTESDLRGVDTHGIFRLPHYCQRIRAGGINLRPRVHPVRENAVTALVDGDNGMGHVVVTYATQLAIRKASETGLAWVGTFNGNHAGAAAVYTTMALAHDMICMYMTVANGNHMPAWGGVELILGTNPISVAIPAGDEPPIALDIATTVSSYGKIKLAAQKGEPIPVGWMMDRQGQPLTDPRRAAEGFLLPIGGYKGYGLNVVIGMLAGLLNGAAFGRNVVDFSKDFVTRNNSGHMILAMRVDNFQPADTFKKEVDRVIRELRESERMAGVDRIWLPGEMEHYRIRERLEHGIPVAPAVVEELRKVAASVNLSDRLE